MVYLAGNYSLVLVCRKLNAVLKFFISKKVAVAVKVLRKLMWFELQQLKSLHFLKWVY